MKGLLTACVLLALCSSSFAAESGKNGLTVLRFTAEWCAPCRQMNTVYKDVDVVKELGKYTKYSSLDLDKQENVAIAKKYELEYLPAVIVVDKEGKVVKIAYGVMNKKEMIDFLKTKPVMTADGKPQPVLFGGVIRLGSVLAFLGGLIFWIFN